MISLLSQFNKKSIPPPSQKVTSNTSSNIGNSISNLRKKLENHIQKIEEKIEEEPKVQNINKPVEVTKNNEIKKSSISNVPLKNNVNPPSPVVSEVNNGKTKETRRLENLEKARQAKYASKSTKSESIINSKPISSNNDNIIKPEGDGNEKKVGVSLTSTDKKTYKRKSKMEKYKMWTNTTKFTSIDPPIDLPDGSRYRYKITFKYQDEQNNLWR